MSQRSSSSGRSLEAFGRTRVVLSKTSFARGDGEAELDCLPVRFENSQYR